MSPWSLKPSLLIFLQFFLRKFYCEAKPKKTSSRKEKHLHVQAEHYHKNTLKKIAVSIKSSPVGPGSKHRYC